MELQSQKRGRLECGMPRGSRPWGEAVSVQDVTEGCLHYVTVNIRWKGKRTWDARKLRERKKSRKW